MKKRYSKLSISIIFSVFLFSILFMSFNYPKMLNNTNIYHKTEGFDNLTPGEYPKSETMPLLDQPMLNNPGVSALGSSELWKSYPVYPAESIKNNNIRYWKTPNNGKCSRGEMCGGLYSTEYTPTVSPSPEALEFSTERRVNFYNSHEYC